jgi:hypothetical protein
MHTEEANHDHPNRTGTASKEIKIREESRHKEVCEGNGRPEENQNGQSSIRARAPH